VGGTKVVSAAEAEKSEDAHAEAVAKANEAGDPPPQEDHPTSSAIGTGHIVLDSNKSFGLSNVTNATDFFNTASASSQLQSVSQIDISSVDGASRAIAQVDSALGAVSDQRSAFGALQARFSSVISTLQVSGENVTAARSRIMDTDFAGRNRRADTWPDLATGWYCDAGPG